MPNVIRMSLGEIQRVGVWALRALRFPFGVADRGAPLLAFAQAAGPNALGFIRQDEERLKIGSSSLRSERRIVDFGFELEAFGSSLIAEGPPAVDLACLAAARNGFGGVGVHGAFGAPLLEALCSIAVRRGFAASITFSIDSAEGAFCRSGVSGWTLWTPLGASYAGGLEEETPLIQVMSAFSSKKAEMSQRVAAGLAKVRAAQAKGDSFFDIFVFHCDRPETFERVTQVLSRNASDRAARVAQAHAQGVEVEIADFLNLYRLERLTWAPTSERSRAQAAF